MLKISIRNLFIVQFLIGIITLSLMYMMEFIWNYKPCHLCIYERYPYFIIIILSFLGYLFSIKNMQVKKILLFCSIIWLSSASLAFYHSGVEHNIFESKSCKTDNSNIISSVEEMRKFIIEAKAVDCRNPEFRILGWSLAELNLVFSSLIFIILAYNLRRRII